MRILLWYGRNTAIMCCYRGNGNSTSSHYPAWCFLAKRAPVKVLKKKKAIIHYQKKSRGTYFSTPKVSICKISQIKALVSMLTVSRHLMITLAITHATISFNRDLNVPLAKILFVQSSKGEEFMMKSWERPRWSITPLLGKLQEKQLRLLFLYWIEVKQKDGLAGKREMEWKS